MHTSCVHPMLHAVWGLNQLDQQLGFGETPPKRLKLSGTSHVGDTGVYRLTDDKVIRFEMVHQPREQYLIRDRDFCLEWDEVEKLYVLPAIQRLARKIEATLKEYDYTCVQFARQTLPPSDGTGVQSFAAYHNNLSVRSVMKYDTEKQGLNCHLDTLFGGFKYPI